MIALLCSVAAEAALLLGRIEGAASSPAGSKTIVEGNLAGRRVALCVGGMGKVNAAHAATLLIARTSPEALITFGIGGAYPSSGAAVGDLALATHEIAGDEGVLTNEGFKDTEFIGIPLLKTSSALVYNTYPAPRSLLDRAHAALERGGTAGTGTLHRGVFVTLSTCTGTAARAAELEQRYEGLCENMEGAAAAQVAGLHDIPWLEVRGISNIVGDRDLSTWDIPRAAGTAQQALLRILPEWR